MTGIRLRHITFTGPNIKPAELNFDEGLNIIFGASNTGKSFTAKAILFMLGASNSLPQTEEIVAYDSAWLGLTLPNKRNITVYRATRGGHFKLYEGLTKNAPPDDGQILYLKHDSKRTDNISYLMLNAMGFAGKQIVRDGNGAKTNLSIRLLSPYAVVSEEDIIAEKSPVFSSGTPSERTFEQNLFKFLITGIDDSAVVTMPKLTERKVAKLAKIELVDEMIALLDAELNNSQQDKKEIEEQLQKLELNNNGLFNQLEEAQKTLDILAIERRNAIDRRRELQERLGELVLTLHRFAKLESVYNSDLQRLQSIEEGGYILVARKGMECPVCGAPPESQKHNHALEEISLAHLAAAAEARKIEREKRELVQTITSLELESIDLREAIDQINTSIKELDTSIEEKRPLEASIRKSYEAYISKRFEIVKVIDHHENRSKLLARRTEIESESIKKTEKTLLTGPDATTVFKFGETVKSVLTAWHFPNAEQVQFDGKTNEITIGGKSRAANGKGVRAILHAAFNVAIIVYCINNKLPYPGFLVLDTPLLTYREPMSSRHGELSAEEAVLKGTSLAEHFYKHLASLRDEVQFIVIENSDPPNVIRSVAKVETFSGLEGNGRPGLLAKDA